MCTYEEEEVDTVTVVPRTAVRNATSRIMPNPFYRSFIIGDSRLPQVSRVKKSKSNSKPTPKLLPLIGTFKGI